jgi:histone acetyltransferase (RNA polymerase elongator complex component)
MKSAACISVKQLRVLSKTISKINMALFGGTARVILG